MAVDVLMPQMGESIAEGTVVRWLKQVGDTVGRDEPLFEISTDKVDAEIPSPAAGVLSAVNVKEGETAVVNSVVATIAAEGEPAGTAVPVSPPAGPVAAPAPAPGQAAPPPSGTGARPPGGLTLEEARRTKSSPLVRRMASEHNLDITQIAGTGLGGRVTKQDILQVVETKSQSPRPAGPPVIASAGDRVEPLTVMRRKIAEHMLLSRRTSAHVHSVFHVNFSTLERIRREKKTAYEQAGAKLTYMAFIAKAVIDAVRRHPVLNASLDGDRIIYRKDVHLGIAVALENGLIVPVIKHADEKNVLGLSRAIADVAARARSKQLKPDEVQGGTFTITNPGQFGAQFGFPIINQPQVAILGVGTIEKRPIVVNDAIAIRTMTYLTLGFDHRLIDGAVADEFMADIKAQLETFDPQDV